MSGESRQTVTLIVQDTTVATGEGQYPDKAGGQTHSLTTIFRRVAPKEIDAEALRKNLNACLDKVQATLTEMKQRTIDGWDLEGVTVSLAITAEGSVGVATVGMEAGMEVTFKRVK